MTTPTCSSFATYAALMKQDKERYRKEEAREVALIQDWLRKTMSFTIPAGEGGQTIGCFSGTCTYFWNCIVKARQALGLRKLEPKPIQHWIEIVFHVKVIYDIERVAAAMGYEPPAKRGETLSEHDKMLSNVFESLCKFK